MKLSRYRIIKDSYAGFEVQKWRLWWPFWMQCHTGLTLCNTHDSLEKALAFVEWHKAGKEVWREQ